MSTERCKSLSPESNTRCHLARGHAGAHEATDPIHLGMYESNTISWSDWVFDWLEAEDE